MPQIEFVGQSAQDADNIAANPSRLLNLYREPVVSQGRTAYVLKSVLSFGGIFNMSTNTTVRAMATVNDDLWCLKSTGASATLGYLNSAGGPPTPVDSFLANFSVADSNEASISGNNGNLTVVIGGNYYMWDYVAGAPVEPTPGAFSDFGSVTYLSNYTILSELDGRRIQWSDIADPNTLPGLNFTTADGRDDNILRVLGVNGLLYVLKEQSMETWYVTGEAGANAFRRQVGGVVDIGLKSYHAVTVFDAGFFMVGDDDRAYLVAGGMERVSTPPVETAIANNTLKSCVTWTDEGHTFCAIIFTDAPAWVFDLATREWHERAEGSGFSAWPIAHSTYFLGNWYVGRDGSPAILGRLFRNNSDTESVSPFLALPLYRRAVSRTLYLDGKRFSAREVEIFPRRGYNSGTVTLSLRTSKDDGATWTAAKDREFAPGDYDKRIIWRELGQFRQLTVDITLSDAEEVPINAEGRIRL